MENNLINLAIAYTEVLIGNLLAAGRLSENQPVITAEQEVISALDARRLCYRALQQRMGLNQREVDAGNLAVASMLENPSRGQDGLVFIPNTSANRLIVNSLPDVCEQAYGTVLKGMIVDGNGCLRTKTLASNRTLENAEKALRVLGYNVYGRENGRYSVLVPTNQYDVEVAHELMVRQMMKPVRMATYMIKEGFNGLVQTVARGSGLSLGATSAVKDRQHTRS